jgi:adenine phosphoribosyltransferase
LTEAARAARLAVVPVAGRARGKLISPYDGRHGALDPTELRPLIADLVRSADLDGVDYALGIPEGGILPAYAFAVEASVRLVLGTVFQPALPGWIEFLEEHSDPGTRLKRVYGLRRGDRVILVEDEITTGRTVLNCVQALRAAGVTCDQVATVIVVDEPGTTARLAGAGIRLNAAIRAPACFLDQLHGSG